MPVQGEAAQGYKVYQANKKKALGPVVKPPVSPWLLPPSVPVPTGGASATGVLKGIGYGNEVAQGYQNRDIVYGGNARGDEADYRKLQALGLLPGQPAYGSGSGSGSGRGGAGGAVPAPTFDATPYEFNGAPYDTLMAAMQQGYGADQASARSAYAGLDASLAGLTDPYAHIRPAAQAQVDPTALSNLIRSQGGGDAGLQAQAQFLQAENGASAASGDRLAQMLSAAQQSWNQGTQSAGKMAAVQGEGDLMAQFNAMKAQLEAKKLAAQQQMAREQMLAQAAFNERNS